MNPKPSGVIIVIISIIALLVIFQSGHYIAQFMHWITTLFSTARINPWNSRGFAAFVQLILLAVFAGWAINRFRR